MRLSPDPRHWRCLGKGLEELGWVGIYEGGAWKAREVQKQRKRKEICLRILIVLCFLCAWGSTAP